MTETSNKASTIPLNDSCAFFYDLSERYKDILIYKQYDFYQGLNVYRVELEKLLKDLGQKAFPFETKTENSSHRILERFIQGLLECDDQLFHKYLCYFRSPVRIVGSFHSCTMLTKLLEALREVSKKKYAVILDNMNERTPEERDIRRKETLEKVTWINTLFLEAFGECKLNSPTFELEKDLTFSFDNMIFSSEKHKIIGLYYPENSTEIYRQLLYTFPSMFIQKLVNKPNEPIDESYCCFVFNDNWIYTCLGKFKKESTSSEIQIEHSLLRTQMSLGVGFSFSNISRYINSKIEKSNPYFALEAIKYSEMCFNKGSLKEFYESIFKNMSKRKSSRKPKPSHVEMVKKQSEIILRDVTNFYRNTPNNTLKSVLQQ